MDISWRFLLALLKYVYLFNKFRSRISHRVSVLFFVETECNISGLYSKNTLNINEECRLLGYKNPVRASQETHDFSAAQPRRLMLYNILGFTTVTKKNTFFWDIRKQFVFRRRYMIC
jgi:hypothetical protein